MSDFVPIRNDEFQVEELEGELLLYHAGKTETLYLNEPAAIVWYLCDNNRTEQQIVQMLKDSYPDVGDSIAEDVSDALDKFIKFGGIEART